MGVPNRISYYLLISVFFKRYEMDHLAFILAVVLSLVSFLWKYALGL